MPPVVVLTSDNRRQSVAGGAEMAYLDLPPSVGVTPSPGHTKARLTYDVSSGPGGTISLYLPSGESLDLFSDLGPLFYVGYNGTVTLFGTKLIQNLDTIDPDTFLHIAGGTYVGSTALPQNPGSQFLGLHFGAKQGYSDGMAGNLTVNTHFENTTYLDHWALSNADGLSGKVVVTQKAAAGGASPIPWAEFLIQGHGSGSGIVDVTMLHDYSAGMFGVDGAGTTYELRYIVGSNKMRLYSSLGQFANVAMIVNVAYTT